MPVATVKRMTNGTVVYDSRESGYDYQLRDTFTEPTMAGDVLTVEVYDGTPTQSSASSSTPAAAKKRRRQVIGTVICVSDEYRNLTCNQAYQVYEVQGSELMLHDDQGNLMWMPADLFADAA